MKEILHNFINKIHALCILHRAGVLRFDWTRFSKLMVLISILGDFQFRFDFSQSDPCTDRGKGWRANSWLPLINSLLTKSYFLELKHLY